MKLFNIKDQYKEQIADMKKKNIKLGRKIEEAEINIE